MTLEACPRGVVVGGAIAHPSGLRRKLAPKSRAAPAHKPPSWDRVPAVVAVVCSKFWFPGRGKLFGSCRKPLHGPSHSGRPRPSVTRLMGIVTTSRAFLAPCSGRGHRRPCPFVDCSTADHRGSHTRRGASPQLPTISAESLGRCVPMVAAMARVGRSEMLIYI